MQAATNNLIIENGPKWFNSPVTTYDGSIEDIQKLVPDFERRPFSLGGSGPSFEHKRLETIIRMPTPTDPHFIPVGVVSKEYVLISHAKVIDVAIRALEEHQIDPVTVKATVSLTEYGERMALSLYLPDKYAIAPDGKHKMTLRLECFNSVDGSSRFRALMGWFRFVCSNGLIIGTTKSDMRRRHVGDLDVADIYDVLTNGLRDSDAEKENFEKWHKHSISIDQLTEWVDNDLKKLWGFKAAARAFQIAKTGYDVDITGDYKDKKPSNITVEHKMLVPGAAIPNETLFDISQTLAWIAKERRDISEQLQWREQIPELLNPLQECR